MSEIIKRQNKMCCHLIKLDEQMESLHRFRASSDVSCSVPLNIFQPQEDIHEVEERLKNPGEKEKIVST